MKEFPENPNYDHSKGLFNVLTNEQVEWMIDTMPERQKRFKSTLEKMREELKWYTAGDFISDVDINSPDEKF